MSFVYVLSTGFDSVYKVGHTTRSVEERLAELNSSTSVIEPMEVLVSFQVFNSYEVEQEAHELLRDYRVRGDREYFKADLMAIVGVIATHLDANDEPYKLYTYGDVKLDEEKLSLLSGKVINEYLDKEEEKQELEDAEAEKTHKEEMALLDKYGECQKLISEMYDIFEQVSFKEQDILYPDFDKDMGHFNKQLDALSVVIDDSIEYEEALPVRKLKKKLNPLFDEISSLHRFLSNNYKQHLGFFKRLFG